jgi:hypothetical protein
MCLTAVGVKNRAKTVFVSSYFQVALNLWILTYYICTHYAYIQLHEALIYLIPDPS